MAGTIILIWFENSYNLPGNGPDLRFYSIETELPDFATVCEYLDADRLIGGAVLRTRRTGTMESTIVGRHPIAFRGAAVARCELPRWAYVEEGGNPA